MEIADLIMALADMESKHGSCIKVLCNHDDMSPPVFVAAENGCPAYISIESE